MAHLAVRQPASRLRHRPNRDASARLAVLGIPAADWAVLRRDVRLPQLASPGIAGLGYRLVLAGSAHAGPGPVLRGARVAQHGRPQDSCGALVRPVLPAALALVVAPAGERGDGAEPGSERGSRGGRRDA